MCRTRGDSLCPPNSCNRNITLPAWIEIRNVLNSCKWPMPRLRMRWPGLRKVRRQVYKRIENRMKYLALPDISAYRLYFDTHQEEWSVLDTLCWIPITLFYRHHDTFDHLWQEILPNLAEIAFREGGNEIRC